MVGDLQQMRQRAAAATSLTGGSGRSTAGLSERYAARIAANEKRRAEEAERERQLELERLRILAEKDRDKRQQGYEMANTGQRAMYAADAAANEFGYRSKLTKQEEIAQRQRDMLQNRFEEARARQLALEQELRDKRQFGFSQQEDATQFQNTLQRDAVQQDYTKERDRFQNDATLQRDANQFGYQFLGDEFGQRRTLERDAVQNRQQRDRDTLLNQFSTEADLRQFEQQRDRDMLLNDFSTQQDFRQQGFTQENMYQREAADISTRWQETIAQARNAGMDFSDRQKKEMQDLESSFRKNVMNGPYDEGLKQQAMVEYQKKLSAIVPEEKVSTPDDEIAQTFKYNEQMGTWLKRGRDSRGFPDWEPLGNGAGGQGEDKMAQAAEKQAAQQQEKMQKAEVERLERFDDLVEKLSIDMDPETEELKYKTREDVMKAAMDRFAPYEQHYRSAYGLQPLGPFQAEADQKRTEQEEKQRRFETLQRIQQEREQYRAAGESAGAGMADSARLRSGDGPTLPMTNRTQAYTPQQPPVQNANPSVPQSRNQNPWNNVPAASQSPSKSGTQKPPKPPIVGAMVPLSKDLVSTLDKIPGGTDLHKLRKKHESNSHLDQTIRTATDIVIMSMLTNDTSDPDFEEALKILADHGVKVQ